MPVHNANRLLRIAVLGLACLPACNSGNSDGPFTPIQPQGSPVMMAIYNATDFDLVELQVGDELYGTLPSDERADARLFPFAYHYNYVSAFVDGERLQIQPIDYVGETPLRAGNYTYVIGLEGNQLGFRRLTIGVIQD